MNYKQQSSTLPCLLVLALLSTTTLTKGQPVLNFKRVVNNWPTIELYFSVACNGQQAYDMQKGFFTIAENGLEIPGATNRTHKALENGNCRVHGTSADAWIVTLLESMVVTGTEDLSSRERSLSDTTNNESIPE
jgi:hypothetical protein